MYPKMFFVLVRLNDTIDTTLERYTCDFDLIMIDLVGSTNVPHLSSRPVIHRSVFKVIRSVWVRTRELVFIFDVIL